MSANLYEVLRKRFDHAIDGVALRVPDGPTWTYRQLDARSAAMAGALTEAGVAVGDRVVVQVDKSPDAVALYLACLRIGAVFLPLNTAYTPSEVQFFVGDATPSLVVARPGTLDELGIPVLSLGTDQDGSFADATAAAAPVEDTVPRDGDDLAAMLYTSGTTGRSKGAMLTHANLESNARALYEIWGFGTDDVLLHTLPVFHVHGLFVALHCAMFGGNEIVFLPRFDVDSVIDHLPEATVMMGVPTQYVRLLGDERCSADSCASIRLFTSGSAPMTESVHAEFTERTGLRILERYGMTEAGMITSNPYDGDRIPGTVGFPLPGVELRVAGDEGSPLPIGETGVAEIRSPGLFAGYWGLPEKTAAEFRDGGWFITGDVGSVDADGRLTLEGRAGDMIISGGFNIYPKEIEQLIDEVDGVSESAVIGVEHRDFGEAVVAVVVPTDTATDAASLESTICAALDGELARFKHPKRYVFVEALPRNAMSKVQKASLRTDHASTFLDH
ncbi:MAG: AMP-binding protein [Acidimicrobiia bacterium]|nr:AMP-binding protein [Acidimicrobiia bacterium]